jgi:hypothetical protein
MRGCFDVFGFNSQLTANSALGLATSSDPFGIYGEVLRVSGMWGFAFRDLCPFLDILCQVLLTLSLTHAERCFEMSMV